MGSTDLFPIPITLYRNRVIVCREGMVFVCDESAILYHKQRIILAYRNSTAVVFAVCSKLINHFYYQRLQDLRCSRVAKVNMCEQIDRVLKSFVPSLTTLGVGWGLPL